MNKISYGAGICLIWLCALLITGAGAQDSQQSPSNPPRQYELKLISISDASSEEAKALRVIRLKSDNTFPSQGFKSLYAPRLREWVKNIPDGSTIEWAPGCLRTGREPKQDELNDFQSFCQSEGVSFVVHPSG